VNKYICINSHTNTPQNTQEIAQYHEFAGNDYSAGLFDNAEGLFKWWKEHAQMLLYLSRLARRYLTMSVTGAPVERLFSVAGQVVTAKRASLDLHTVTLLVFLHEAFAIVR